ncbi:hypothetical protein BHM03_00006618 [Ensete ventricosum]|nr:hypothetical protein BHM03_00006618 [Ensete ventricosum]
MRQQQGRITIACCTCLPPRTNWRPRHAPVARLPLSLRMSTDRPSHFSHCLGAPNPLEDPLPNCPLTHLLPTLLLHRSHGDRAVGAACSTAAQRFPATKVFEDAMRKNTIAVLETGAGKTFIAVMLMKEFGKRLIVDDKKMMIIFVAPTVKSIL